MGRNGSLNVITEGAVVVALCVALSFIPLQTPHGAIDIQLGAIPMMLYAFRRGPYLGMVAGLLWGLVQIVDGQAMKNFLSVLQLLMEYPLAYACLGLAGIFSKGIKRNITRRRLATAVIIVSGVVLATLIAWTWHYLAGAFVWSQYAPKSVNPFLYSLVFNGTSAALNLALSTVVLLILANVAPKLFIPKDEKKV